MRNDVRFYPVIRVRPKNQSETTMFGVGVDRSLWVELKLAGVSDAKAQGIRLRHGNDTLRTGPLGRVYVDARALVLESPDPVEQEAMVAMIRDLTGRLRPVTSSRDGMARN